MATKEEFKQQKEAFNELQLATQNLERTTAGLGTLGIDNRSFLSAFGKDLGKLGGVFSKFNALGKLQLSQFAIERVRNSRLNVFRLSRERQATKLLARQES